MSLSLNVTRKSLVKSTLNSDDEIFSHSGDEHPVYRAILLSKQEHEN